MQQHQRFSGPGYHVVLPKPVDLDRVVTHLWLGCFDACHRSPSGASFAEWLKFFIVAAMTFPC